jgi:hypothetical protein
MVLIMPTSWTSSRLLDRRLLQPDPKRLGPGPSISAGTQAMTPWPEVAVDDGVRREERLRLVGSVRGRASNWPAGIGSAIAPPLPGGVNGYAVY